MSDPDVDAAPDHSHAGSRLTRTENRWLQRLSDPVVLVLLITTVALALRFVGLGARVAHQDEARVAYWISRYVETGVWEYRRIVHGPFLVRVNSVVFQLFGENDFTMRAVVALLGGILPLGALLFRERLRPSETVALAFLLALNPVLLYYSRFMRNDVPLAAAMVFALGFFVRAYDTRNSRRWGYFFAGVACFALGFTMKENAVLYAACWGGAAVLLYDHRLFLRRVGNEGFAAALPPRVRSGGARVLRRDFSPVRSALPYVGVALLAVVEFLAIIILAYAPRSRTEPGPGLWKALSDPATFPAVVGEATVGTWMEFQEWTGHQDHPYLPYLGDFVRTLEVGALALALLAVVGFLVDRYSGDRPRDVVAFGFYWGVASVLGYPLVMDIKAGWATVHAIVPLAFPAAVALALVFRWGWEGYERSDDVSIAAAAILLLLVVGQVGVAAYDTTYRNSADPDNQLVQYAQSSSDSKPLLADLQRIARENGGPDGSSPDVLYYGEEFHSRNESAHDVAPVGENGSGWFARLPLEWYFESVDAETISTNESADLAGEKPPIVVALNDTSTCYESVQNASDIDQHMDGYERYDFQRFGYNSGCTISSIVIYVDEDRISSPD